MHATLAIALKYPLDFGGLYLSTGANVTTWMEGSPNGTEYSIGAMAFKNETTFQIGGPLGDDGKEILVKNVKLYVKKEC
jgi:hypothetical protein